MGRWREGCIAHVQHTSQSATPGAFPKKFWWKIINVAEVNQLRWLEESGQWLENVDRTHLFLPSGNPVLQKIWVKIIRLCFNFLQKCKLFDGTFDEKDEAGKKRMFVFYGNCRKVAPRGTQSQTPARHLNHCGSHRWQVRILRHLSIRNLDPIL